MRHTNTTPETDQIILINGELTGFTIADPLSSFLQQTILLLSHVHSLQNGGLDEHPSLLSSGADIAQSDSHMVQIYDQSQGHFWKPGPGKGIHHHICLPRVIMNGQIIIFNQFEPPTLPQIQLFLSENVLETLMIDVNVTRLTIKIMPPQFQGKHNSGQLEVMGRIIPLMFLQLPRAISNHPAFLHQHTFKANTRSIRINYETLTTFRQG